MASIEIKVRKADGEIIKWVSSPGFRLPEKLDSVGARALKWKDEDGITEEITDQERLFQVANPARVFDVAPKAASASAPVPAAAAPSAMIAEIVARYRQIAAENFPRSQVGRAVTRYRQIQAEKQKASIFNENA